MLSRIQSYSISSNYGCAENLRKQDVFQNNGIKMPNNPVNFTARGNCLQDNSMRNIGIGLFALAAVVASLLYAHQAGYLNKISAYFASLS